MNVYKYIEWFDASEMHQHSKECLSQLFFIRDEQQFLNSLTKSMCFRTIHQNQFEKVKKFRGILSEKSHLLNPLINLMQKHISQLKILVDGANQLKREKDYRKSHKAMIKKIDEYVAGHKAIKKEGFELFSMMLKGGKKLLLSNPEYKLKTVTPKAII